jgi:hypothetical protein
MTEVFPFLTGNIASCVFLESLHHYKSFDTNYVDFVQNIKKYGHLQLSVSENHRFEKKTNSLPCYTSNSI